MNIKRLSKIILLMAVVTFTLNSPLKVFAEPVEQVQSEVTEPVEQVQNEVEEEGIKVDDSNNSPFLETKEEQEKKDQSIRDKEIINTPIETPASVTGERYKGSGTVVDFTTTGSKAFYTVKAQDNSVYYIVIDMDMTENNVYFLSEINGEELSLKEITAKSPVPTETKPTQPVTNNKKKGSNSVFWVVLIGAIALFGYQLAYGKLKNLNPLNKNKIEDPNNKKEEMKNKDIYQEEDLLEDEEYFVDDVVDE